MDELFQGGRRSQFPIDKKLFVRNIATGFVLSYRWGIVTWQV
jgi:hypothetical protein